VKNNQLQLIEKIFGGTLHEVDELPVWKVNDETSTNEKSRKGSTNFLENSIQSSQEKLHIAGA